MQIHQKCWKLISPAFLFIQPLATLQKLFYLRIDQRYIASSAIPGGASKSMTKDDAMTQAYSRTPVPELKQYIV